MKYNPSAVASKDLQVSKAPYFGGEWSVYMTTTPAVLIGEIDLTAASAAIFIANAGAAIKAAGADLQMVPITEIRSAGGALAVVMNALDTSGTPVVISGTGTFTPPARAQNQTFNFARGYAVDMVIGPVASMASTRAITSNVATVVTAAPHHLTSGMHITTTLFGVGAYNVTNVVVTVVNATTITFPVTHADEATTGDVTGVITPVITSLFSAISSLASVANGDAQVKLRIYQLPEAADYTLIEPTTEIDFNTKSRMAKGVDSGMEADAYVKRGKTQPGELSIGSKFKNFEDGMARFDGQKCVCMLVGIKEGVVLNDRVVFVDYVPTVKPKFPDGDGEATMEATGKFTDHLFFVAP